MKIQNTEKSYKIVKINEISTKNIIEGIVAFSLLESWINFHLKKMENEQKFKEGEAMHGYYSIAYINALKQLNVKDYDEAFIDIYKNGHFNIDGTEYGIAELYLSETQDGNIYLIKAGENKTDILSKTDFNSKRLTIVDLRDSSIFYKMYKAGIIKDKEIKLTIEQLKEYINEWDKKRHYEIPELKAKKEASAKFQERYGDKGAKQ